MLEKHQKIEHIWPSSAGGGIKVLTQRSTPTPTRLCSIRAEKSEKHCQYAEQPTLLAELRIYFEQPATLWPSSR